MPQAPLVPGTAFVDMDLLATIALGGALHALAVAGGGDGEDALARLLEDEGASNEISLAGAREAAGMVADQYRRSCDWFEVQAGD